MKTQYIDFTGIVIETRRLVLRLFQEDDLVALHEYASVEGVGEGAGWVHHKTMEESKRMLDLFLSEPCNFAVTLKENGKLIGAVGVEESDDFVYKSNFQGKNLNDVSYIISKDYWGNGYATEAVKALIDYMFSQFGCDALTCWHYKHNDRSRRVAEKCGFVFYKKFYAPSSWSAIYEGLAYYISKKYWRKNRERYCEDGTKYIKVSL